MTLQETQHFSISTLILVAQRGIQSFKQAKFMSFPVLKLGQMT